LAILFADAGKIIDSKQHSEPTARYMSPAFFVTSLGFLLWGATRYLISINPVMGGTETGLQDGLQIFVYSIVFAIVLALAGIRVSSKPREQGKKSKR
jgi:putative membrane protein